MNKTTEALKLALNLLEGEWPEGDEIAQPVIDAIREALADHSGDGNEMVAEPAIPEWVDVDDYEEPVKQEPVAGERCIIVESCKRCPHSFGRQSCALAERAFDEPLKRSTTPPEWCPLPLYATPQPVKQEPVAWVNAERNTITWEKIYPNMEPLYAAPVSAEAIRAEALEEAAKVCDEALKHDWNIPHKPALVNCAAAIRGLK